MFDSVVGVFLPLESHFIFSFLSGDFVYERFMALGWESKWAFTDSNTELMLEQQINPQELF